jgi:uncharacterized protein (DUF885 family)
MKNISVILTFLHCCASTMNVPIAGNGLFSDRSNQDYYWEALMQVAKNKKENALKIVAALKKGDQLSLEYPWKNEMPENIDDFFDHLFLSMIKHDPQMLTYLGLFESIGIREHNAYLNDVSPALLELELREKKKNAELLQKYSLETLTLDQKLSRAIFLWKLNHDIEGERFLFHEYKINQMFGILVDLSMTLMEFHRIELAEDCDHYFSRLHSIPTQFDQAIMLLKHQQSLGITPPCFALEKVINIINRSLPANVEENMYYLNLAKKIEKLEGIEKKEIMAKAKKSIETVVHPAYKKLRDFCVELRSVLTANNGVWALPHGDEYYAHQLARHTTTTLTADEIHELGLKEVAQIHAQMRAIFIREGLNDPAKTVGQLMQELSKDECFYFPDTQEGKKQCLAEFEAICERSRKELYPLFDKKPKAKLKIQAVPPHEEEGQPGAYYAQASMDGSRPGIFFANLRSMKEVPKYHMETLTVHEAEPGHHFQIALQLEMEMPILRKLGDYNVFYEGWALYTEKLAYEQGFYSSSFSQLGHLGDELFRAARLVVDTGIHKKRWTREQAINYMVEVTGSLPESMATEVERYFVLPGQACSYKIGQLKILELRQRAKDALGSKFDIREFHNVVLKLAAAPLTILEEVVDQYIKEKH